MSLEEIANWASVLTGEDRRFGENGNHYYYVSDPVKRLIWKITHLNRQLIALIGLQGTGKTSALKYAFSKLLQVPTEEDRNPVIFIKLTKNLQESLERACTGAISKSIKEGKRELHAEHPFATLTKSEIKERTYWAIRQCINEVDIILVDLPDYSKSDRRLMTKDLSHIQELWRKSSGHIVVAIQEELFKGHFFFGKMSVIKLKPLKPEELVDVFKTQFPDCKVITENALTLIAELSRGVFRRFLKYLGLTIERFMLSGTEPPIKPENVEDAITVDVIIEDMELELYDTFKDSRMRHQAVKLLNHLRKVGKINQKQIADFLNVTMTTAGRIVNGLEDRYIKRERGKGREWLISLKV